MPSAPMTVCCLAGAHRATLPFTIKAHDGAARTQHTPGASPQGLPAGAPVDAVA
ncbi:hypothetical protein [Streptomyces sp. JH34]|uniref:hypothetical protein n=1 Tax=Streptomyces sp. JH34 TaxID=2793633 RepID=UPI0023F66403|nr:hypothetical protein [Streptomyces sp. JH34]MDF6018262.1 hypothetical protein [Streptomyces sp. JH34]